MGGNVGINTLTASLATLQVGGNVYATSFTGSFLGTASYAQTASFALNGGGGGLSALYIQDEGVTQGTASYINFTGTGVTATVTAGTASISITGGGGGGEGQSVVHTQASSSTTWTFNHNLNSQYLVYDVYDSNSNAIIPANVSASSANTLIITFSVATAGYAVATVGGGLPFISASFNGYVLTASGSVATWAPTSSLSVLSASYANNATSASYAATSSFTQNAFDILRYVKNSSGAQINKGKVVRITGAVGDNALIGTASYIDDNNSANTLGITFENIANDSFGYVITEGTLIGINTDAFTAGQLIGFGGTTYIIFPIGKGSSLYHRFQ